MNKIMLELYLPACGKSIDVRVPLHLKVGEVREMMVNYFEASEECDYIPSANALLCDSVNGIPYDLNKFICQLGLSNGSKIMLI